MSLTGVAVAAIASVALTGCVPLGLGMSNRGSSSPTSAGSEACRITQTLRGDMDGDGRADRVTLSEVGHNRYRCRAVLTVHTAGGTVRRLLPTAGSGAGMVGEFPISLNGLGNLDRRSCVVVMVTLVGVTAYTPEVLTLRSGRIEVEPSILWYYGSANATATVACPRPGRISLTSVWYTGSPHWTRAHEQRQVFTAEALRFRVDSALTVRRTTTLAGASDFNHYQPPIPIPRLFAGCFTTPGDIQP
jgi:hypothetical protein